MLKAFKYRIYPNEEQAAFLNKNIGAARFIYNWGLAMRKADYEKQKLEGVAKPKTLSIFEISKKLPALKKQEEFKWLKEVNSVSLITSLRNLDTAYKNFFRNVKKGTVAPGFPKFKNKFGDQSFQFHQEYSVDFEKSLLHIPKCKDIKIVLHRPFTGAMKTATISRDTAYRFFISILVDSNEALPDIPSELSGTVIGIDHGIRNYITLSDGMTWENPKIEKKEERRLARLARSLSRKKKGGANREKARRKKAKLDVVVSDRRDGFIQKVTSEMVDYFIEREVNSVAIRKYDIKKMTKKIEPKPSEDSSNVFVKNGRERQKKFNRSIKDVAWGKLSNVLAYKCLKNGIRLVEVSPEFTSTTCFRCGHNEKENVKDSEFLCTKCGHQVHVDLNAAQNTAKAGETQIMDLLDV